MPTSGSTDFSLNAREVCTYALKLLREVPAGGTPSAEDMADAVQSLNLMLKSWQMTMPNLWRKTNASLTLLDATASYSLPAVYRLRSARLRQSGRDMPLNMLTSTDYEDLVLKSSAGTTTNFYFDPQRATSTLYVWPVLATAGGATIEYTYQRRYEDIDDEDNDLDIPQEYLQTVGYNLAENLLDMFGKEATTMQRIMLKAKDLRDELKMADREDVVQFVPG